MFLIMRKFFCSVISFSSLLLSMVLPMHAQENTHIGDRLDSLDSSVSVPPRLSEVRIYEPIRDLSLPRSSFFSVAPLSQSHLQIPHLAIGYKPSFPSLIGHRSIRLDALHRYDMLSSGVSFAPIEGVDIRGVLSLGVRELTHRRSYDLMGSLSLSYQLSNHWRIDAGGAFVSSPWDGRLGRGTLGLHWANDRWELGVLASYTEYQWLMHRMRNLGVAVSAGYHISDRVSVHSVTHLPLSSQGYQADVINRTVLKWRFSDRWKMVVGTETYFDIRRRRVVVRPTGGLEYDAGRK